MWAFGDGGQAAGTEATHTYTTPGTYTATVTVSDPRGASGTATVQVVVTAAQGSAAPSAQQRHRQRSPRRSAPAAWFGVSPVAKTTVARFSQRGLAGAGHLHRGDVGLRDA